MATTDATFREMYDTDLPQSNRTEANYWKAKYFEASNELRKSNLGCSRLRYKLNYANAKMKAVIAEQRKQKHDAKMAV